MLLKTHGLPWPHIEPNSGESHLDNEVLITNVLNTHSDDDSQINNPSSEIKIFKLKEEHMNIIQHSNNDGFKLDTEEPARKKYISHELEASEQNYFRGDIQCSESNSFELSQESIKRIGIEFANQQRLFFEKNGFADKEAIISEFASKLAEVLKGTDNNSDDESEDKDEDEDIWQTFSDTEQRCIPCTLHAHKAPKKLIGQHRGVMGFFNKPNSPSSSTNHEKEREFPITKKITYICGV